MAIECCGKVRDTPFCSQCGKRLSDISGLGGLLERCRQNERKIRVEYQNMLLCAGRDKPNVIRQRNAKIKHADKWKAWGDALAKLLSADE